MKPPQHWLEEFYRILGFDPDNLPPDMKTKESQKQKEIFKQFIAHVQDDAKGRDK